MSDEIEYYYYIGERAKSMEKSNTREEILEAALDLFAVNGYEATSISQLADAVGDTSGGLLEWWHDPGVPLAFPVESASS